MLVIFLHLDDKAAKRPLRKLEQYSHFPLWRVVLIHCYLFDLQNAYMIILLPLLLSFQFPLEELSLPLFAKIEYPTHSI